MGNVCRWLSEQAEQLGIEIFPGFSAHSLIIEDDAVKGIITGDMGVDENGNKKDGYMPGMELRAKYTIFAEGCRGHLGKEIINSFNLDEGKSPQHYGLGFKEIWQIDADKHVEGTVVHTTGWPLTGDTNGGSFMYHSGDNQIVVGLIIDLNYANPHLSPYDEFQRMKHHPVFAETLKGGKRISYGARAISEGGFQSIPKLTFPGGMLVGDTAGFLNVPKIKGTHTSMKSAMVAAEAVFELLPVEYDETAPGNALEATAYPDRLKKTWLWSELYKVRNIRPGFKKGLWLGLINGALESFIFKGKTPWTMGHHKDHEQTGHKDAYPKIDYPKPDGKISFDRLSSVFLSNTYHEENQPAHLKLLQDSVPIELNLAEYDAPEQRYCPAGVYEIVEIENKPHLQINAQNCVHCKTCDIKDPSQNIHWTVPEGGGGPNYPNM